jgi:hypothetical protein
MKDEKVKAASQELAQQLGVGCGSAYGFSRGIEGMNAKDSPESFIIVWSNAPVVFPKTYKGFTVVRYDIPVAY